jgi:uncharacterized paraquat-inducible protein A
LKFSCPNCGDALRCDGDAAGRQVRCPRCSTPFTVGDDEPWYSEKAAPAAHTAPLNPFGRGIQTVWRQTAGMRWEAPYLHNVVSLVVFVLVLVVLFALYPTIGLAVHLTLVFSVLIRQSADDMAARPVVEKMGQGVAIGIYAVFYCVFGAVALPFFVLGWSVGKIVGARGPKG